MSGAAQERLRQAAEAAGRRGRTGPIVMHTRDLAMEFNGTHHTAYVSEPQLLGSCVQTMAMLVNEIPPGARLVKHRHLNESFMYILSGRGHSIVEGEWYDWAQGDVVSEPMWAWHEHTNDDPERPVRYVGVTNVPLLRAMGINQREVAGT